MKKLFEMSKQYVIIYAKNEDINHTVHVKFRKFSSYIENNLPEWQLIKHIPNKYPQLNIGQNRLNFIKCDAMKIKSLFKKNYFNCIICLESAFHYSNRKHFFSHVKSLLKTNGSFIIGDIVLKERQSNDNIIKRGFMKLFEKVFSDFFHIPFVNLISQSEWQNDITNAGLELSYINNITEKTFVPYYKHYFNEYIKKKNYPNCLATYLLNLFTYCQPFDYVIAVFNC